VVEGKEVLLLLLPVGVRRPKRLVRYVRQVFTIVSAFLTLIAKSHLTKGDLGARTYQSGSHYSSYSTFSSTTLTAKSHCLLRTQRPAPWLLAIITRPRPTSGTDLVRQASIRRRRRGERRKLHCQSHMTLVRLLEVPRRSMPLPRPTEDARKRATTRALTAYRLVLRSLRERRPSQTSRMN
jgi:hypothetical protein